MNGPLQAGRRVSQAHSLRRACALPMRGISTHSRHNYLVLSSLARRHPSDQSFLAPSHRSLSLWPSSATGTVVSSTPSPASTPSSAPPEVLSETAPTASAAGDASSAAATSLPTPTTFTAPTSTLDVDPSSTTDIINAVIANGDHIGDLSALGLTSWTSLPSLVRIIMEQLHVTVGLPWWGTILTVTLIGRIIAIPFMKKNNINATGMAEIQPQLTKYMEQLKVAKREGNVVEQGKAQTRITTLFSEKGVHPLKALPSAGVQMITGIVIFFAIRKMTMVPVESMTTGGIFTFPDLTVADPTYALPVVAVLATLASAKSLDVPTVEGGHARNVATALTMTTAFIVPFLPSALGLYIAANGILRTAQQFAMRLPAVREMSGLPERKAVLEKTPSFKDTYNKYKKEFAEKWNDEKIREKAFQNSRVARAAASSPNALREQFVAAGSKKGPKAYKRPVVVYEDQVADVVKKENEFYASQQYAGAMYEPEKRRKGKRASA